METGLKVMDAMTKRPVVISPGTSVSDAAELMKKEHVGNILVTEGDKLIGIVTEQDMVYRCMAEKKDPEKTEVAEIMSRDIYSIGPDKDIIDAMLMMSSLNVRRFPVIEDNILLGILTQKDILKIEPELFQLVVDKIELREEESKPIHRISEREGICSLCGNYTPFLFEQEGVMVCKDCRY